MGLDVYAGPLTRYLAGDWLTIVQQAGLASGREVLRGAEWCLPLATGPTLFGTQTPNGGEVTMGRVDNLVSELRDLNEATLRLSPAALAAAREDGPPEPGAPVAAVAPFGLAVLLHLAEYAAAHRVPWIMDY